MTTSHPAVFTVNDANTTGIDDVVHEKRPDADASVLVRIDEAIGSQSTACRRTGTKTASGFLGDVESGGAALGAIGRRPGEEP